MNKAIAQGKVKQHEGLKAVQSLRGSIGKATANLEAQGHWSLESLNPWLFTEAEAFKGFEKQLSGTALFQAKREYFYSTDGKEIDSQQRKEIYDQILEGKKVQDIDTKAQIRGMQQFNSVEEADSSGLKSGTIVLIDGRRYKI